ncbi:D-alanyl-D-alanine carboxypeptidase [Caproiciproducens galactitolivorans]|uniref:serine-type D-Ala-D-Ala carboxypeptidase n=1 Tax=Caproiciproducens galactitolivorans TaxID=642589 RepID=A0A4Z0YBH6_9FIRM|nr:D-alanyl-D-alanine carboxypeptidase family protein [Caproiciproducens galactitolivorans]QEY34011.1 D-alanyl-D-alanine carboxypeptidase [Caproiciproducens galactitolivorans]TGJ76581.1 D-alanyl-D-alanine carboxypeptidase DacF precursor [Caproiciproducens galactitolivorans]
MKLKKLSACFLVVTMLVSILPVRAAALSDAEVKAPSALLMESQTGKVLYEKNAHEKRPCASITKVMTLLLVMEALDSGKIKLTDMVSASEHAASMGGSDIWLKPGETMTVDDMLKATVIASANDAAVALAEYVSGSEDEFLQQMNQKAKQLGMNDTCFKNCNGLDEDGHVTSAYDVAVMSRELIKHKKIFDYTKIWIENIRGGKTQLVNTNKLLKSYRGITGLKTGTTGKAGSCISATAERDNVKLISVILGASNTKDRFSSACTLLDYGFANWAVTTPALPKEALKPINVINGMNPTVETTAETGSNILVPKGKANDIQYSVTLNENVTAPVKKGQIVGKIVYKLGNEVVKECPICAKNSVEKISFGSVFRILAKYLFKMI